MSLVESWPSTETRSNERSTHTPSSRSAVSARQRGVGLDEAEHRRERRRDHARALGLRASAARCRTAARRRPSTSLANLSVVRIASEKSPWPSVAQLAARARRCPRITLAGVERHADHAGRGDRDLVLAHAAGHRRGALHARGLLEAAAARSRRSRCRSWRRRRGARPAACAPCVQHDRRGQHAGAREARRADAVGRRTRSARGPAAGRLEPAATPAARNPAGRSPRVLGHVPGHVSQRSSQSPSVSGRPNIRFRFWTACDAAPFHRLSIAAKTITRPVRASSCNGSGSGSSRARRACRRAVDELDERLAAYASRTARRAPSASVARRRDVGGDEFALVERHEVRHERDRDVVAERASSCSISGVWRWPSIL